MTMVGADTTGLAELASEFGDAADELDDLARRLAQSIQRTDSWQGPSADRCKDQWTGLAQTQMRQVADDLNASSRHLQLNAWAQDLASGDTNLYSVLRGIYDVGVLGYGAYKLSTLGSALGRLGRFFQALRMPAQGFAMLSRVEKFIGIGKELLKSPLVRFLGRAAPVVSLGLAAKDLYTGGGYEGGRQWATRGYALAGVAGGAATVALGLGVVAATPLVVGVAVVGGVVYAAGSLINYAIDNRESIARAYDVSTNWVADRFRDATRNARFNALSMLASPTGGGGR